MSAHILVVDNEECFTRMLRLVLEAQEYTVAVASTAASAVRAIIADSFDIVLTDMKMENDTAGYEVVRAAHALPHPPAVVIITAFPLSAGEWMEAGADAAITKPTKIDVLLQLISNLLLQRAANAAQAS